MLLDLDRFEQMKMDAEWGRALVCGSGGQSQKNEQTTHSTAQSERIAGLIFLSFSLIRACVATSPQVLLSDCLLLDGMALPSSSGARLAYMRFLLPLPTSYIASITRCYTSHHSPLPMHTLPHTHPHPTQGTSSRMR